MDKIVKPKNKLKYEHIEHLDKNGFERYVVKSEFMAKFSQSPNIMNFLNTFRGMHGLSPYDPMPKEELDKYVAERTPFVSWQEFLVSAYEFQATEIEIEELEERMYMTA